MKKVAIVTVCLNAKSYIEKTIESVLMQKNREFEYWIVDGLSTDGTVELIKSYEDKFEKNGISYNCVIKKDKGIFDAMNSSLEMVNAEFVLFLNAGDFLCDELVVENVFNSPKISEADVIYGNFFAYSKNKRKHCTSAPVDEITKRMICSHQAIFTRTELLIKRPYSPKYKMAADYDFYLEKYLQGKKFVKVDVDIVYFDVVGISQIKAEMTQNEKISIQLEHGCITEEEYFRRRKRIKYICLKKKLVQMLPRIIRFSSYEKFDFKSITN